MQWLMQYKCTYISDLKPHPLAFNVGDVCMVKGKGGDIVFWTGMVKSIKAHGGLRVRWLEEKDGIYVIDPAKWDDIKRTQVIAKVKGKWTGGIIKEDVFTTLNDLYKKQNKSK